MKPCWEFREKLKKQRFLYEFWSPFEVFYKNNTIVFKESSFKFLVNSINSNIEFLILQNETNLESQQKFDDNVF